MIKVGILSFSDGRGRVHKALETYINECRDHLKCYLEKTGEVTVCFPEIIINSTKQAKIQGMEMASQKPDAVILNIPVFAFPNFTVIALNMLSIPCLAISPVNGKMPGLGGLQAAVGMIRQLGFKCEKVWGNIEEPETINKVMIFLHAAYAVTSLNGQVYGLLGGRSIGMGTGTVNPDVWMRLFGVDVQHIDQLEIIRRAEHMEGERVEKAFTWLNEKMQSVQYDGDKLTEDSLKFQIRCYYATKELVDEYGLDFIGVKCHFDLSEYYVTQCISAAFFNDPYDWDGEKEPVVFSCEADSDGALTMQIMKLVSGRPVLFFDFRHYDIKDNVFSFCNCGAMSTWYAQRSQDAEENLGSVKLLPIISKYGGKGCHVQYVAKAGEMTFGRLTRVQDKYRFTAFLGNFKRLPDEKLEETCPVWPHGYVETSVVPDTLISRYSSNHIHGIYGNYIDELKMFCEIKGIDYEVIV